MKTFTESRLLFKTGGGLEAASSAEKTATQKLKEAEEGLTFKEAKKLVDEAMKQLTDKVDGWNAADSGQSNAFKTTVDTAVTALTTAKATLDAILASESDETKPFKKENVKDLQTFGTDLEANLTELERQAEQDRIAQKKEQLKTKVADQKTKFTEAALTAEITTKTAELLAKITISDPATKAKVEELVKKNLEGLGARTRQALKDIEDGTLYKGIDDTAAKITESQLDNLLEILDNKNLFPDNVADLWKAPDGVASEKQTDKFIEAVAAVVKNFTSVPRGTNADKAKQGQKSKIDALLDKINKGSISPAEIIAERRQIETAVVIGYLRDKFTAPEDMEAIDMIAQQYALGKWDNKVDVEKIKAFIDKINKDSTAKDLIDVSIEGGADSAVFTLTEKKFEKYKPYFQAAERLLNVTSLSADPCVVAHKDVITEISQITDEAGWETFLNNHGSSLKDLGSATGPFNTILAYMRMENIAGPSLINLADKEASIYLETDKTARQYRYSLVLTLKPEAPEQDQAAQAAGDQGAQAADAASDDQSAQPANLAEDKPKLLSKLPNDPDKLAEFFNAEHKDGKYYMPTNPDYGLTPEEFRLVVGITPEPSKEYMEAHKPVLPFLKPDPAPVFKYDPNSHTIDGTYGTDPNTVGASYDVETGKKTADISNGGNLNSLLVDTKPETLALVRSYYLPLTGVVSTAPAGAGKDLEDAIIAGDNKTAVEKIADSTAPDYSVLCQCLEEIPLADLKTADKSKLKKLDFAKVLETLKGKLINEDLYKNLLILKGKDPENDNFKRDAEIAPLLDLGLSRRVIRRLFSVQENQNNDKLRNLYLTTYAAFNSDSSVEPANIAAIKAYTGKPEDLSFGARDFVIDNFAEINGTPPDSAVEAKTKQILENYLGTTTPEDLGVDGTGEQYKKAYETLYGDTLPSDPTLWGKFMLASKVNITDTPSNVMDSPNAAKYLDAWATIDSLIEYDANVKADTLDNAKKLVEILKKCNHPQNIDGGRILSEKISKFLGTKTPAGTYPEALTLPSAGAKFVAIANDPTRSDDDRLYALDSLLDGDAYLQAASDGTENPKIPALEKTRTALQFKTKAFEGIYEEERETLPEPQKRFVEIWNERSGEDGSPTLSDIDYLIAHSAEIGVDNLYKLAQKTYENTTSSSLWDSQKVRLYQHLGLQGSAQALNTGVDDVDRHLVAAILTDKAEDKKASLDSAFALADADTDSSLVDQLAILGLQNDREKAVVALLTEGAATTEFVKEILQDSKYKDKFTPQEKIDILSVNVLEKLAFEIFSTTAGTEMNLSDINDALENDDEDRTITIEEVLAVLKKEGKKVTTDAREASYFYLEYKAQINALQPAEKTNVLANLGITEDQATLVNLLKKKALTQAEAAQLVTLANTADIGIEQQPLALKSIDVPVATELAKLNWKELRLNSVTGMNDASLLALANFNGELYLPKMRYWGEITVDAYHSIDINSNVKKIHVNEWSRGMMERIFKYDGYRKSSEERDYFRYDDNNYINYRDTLNAEVAALGLDMNGTGDDEEKARSAFVDVVLRKCRGYGIAPPDEFLTNLYKEGSSLDYTANAAEGSKDKENNKKALKPVDDKLAAIKAKTDEYLARFRAQTKFVAIAE
ncbi:MAG: hypothetical protein WC285_03730 [Candidatus Gracilibacteria bacterium]|jgi:hypothetical protein